MASIHKRSHSPYYWAKFIGPDGRQVFRSTKKTNTLEARAIAEDWAKAAKTARNRELTQSTAISLYGRFMEETLGVRLEMATIEGHFQGWLASRSSLGRADATTKRYSGVVDSFLTFLGQERIKGGIGSLTASEIERWRDAELATGKGATTCDFGIKVLRAALETARRKGLAPSNVADAVEKSGSIQEEREPFTDEEIRKLLAVASEEWRGMILFGVHLGLRLLDAASITWGQIDLTEATLSIVPAKTKNHSPKPHILALHPELVTYLQSLPSGIGGAPVFTSLHGRKAGSHGGLSNEFGRLMNTAGVMASLGKEKTGKGRRTRSKGFHALRHTAISRMANAGTSADVRKEIAGHASDAIHRRYTHLSLDAQRTAVAKIPAINVGA